MSVETCRGIEGIVGTFLNRDITNEHSRNILPQGCLVYTKAQWKKRKRELSRVRLPAKNESPKLLTALFPLKRE